MELTKEHREELEARGWELEEDDDEGTVAYLEIDLTTHETDGDFGFLTDYDYEPVVFTDRVFVAWRVDFGAERAVMEVFEGQRTGSEIDEDDDFQGVLDMGVKHVGVFSRERLIGSDNRMRYAWHDLLRVTEDFACALWRLDAGQYLIRVESNVNVEGWEPSTYFRISDEDAERVLKLEEEDRDFAVSAMEDIADTTLEREGK